jgi:CSLREA domain-containing protein
MGLTRLSGARGAVLVMGLCAAVLSAAQPVSAATITVNTTTDEVTPSNGVCSLREAVDSADFNQPGGDCTQGDAEAEDTIQLGPGTYDLVTPFGTLTFQNTMAGGGATIVGAGMSSTTIHASTGFNDQLLFTQAAGPLTVRDLTLDDGGTAADVSGGVESITNSLTLDRVAITDSTGMFGGGVYFQPNTSTYPNAAMTITDSVIDNNTATSSFFMSAQGGGVTTQGKTTISRTAITNNEVLETDGTGGGIHSSGALTLIDDLISGNGVTVTEDGSGGGIKAVASLTAVNVTFTANTVTAASTSQGGAMSTGFPSAALTNVTIAGNTATTAPAIHHTNPVSVRNSIIRDGSSACVGPTTTLGGNIDQGASCWSTSVSGDLQNTDPMVGTPADNGGPTLTMALLPGSPAIDRVPVGSCVDQQPMPQPVTSDQRGTARPQGSACDSGAFEVVQTAPPSPPASPPSAVAPSGITGQRAAAIKRCKKKFRKGTKKRKKCLKRARQLPL